MQIRRPAVAGSFYPFSSSELREMIKSFLESAKAAKQNAIAVVVPHAGYQFCGRTAAAVYKSIKPGFDTVVIIGPNHYGSGGVTTTGGMWQTPLGTVKVDNELAEKIAEKCKTKIVFDSFAQLHEHSIEVQLPWLQHLFKDFSFVPVSINPIYFDKENMKNVGEAIAEAAKALGKKILIVASSDFTHYGSAYGYKPFSGNTSHILKKIKEIDLRIAKAVCDIAPESVIELGKESSACGYGCIAAALYAAHTLGAKSGEVASYSTSFEVSHDADTIVAYCGIVMY